MIGLARRLRALGPPMMALVALSGSAGVVAVAAGGVPVAAAENGVTLSVAPTSVTDGQLVTITVKASPGTVVYEADVNVCRTGVTFNSGAGGSAPNDFTAGLNCPAIPGTPLSTSGYGRRGYSNTILTRAIQPDGASFVYQVGSGTANWSVDGKAAVLTCDADNPCDLVVELSVQQGTAPSRWLPFKQRLTYLGNDPFAGCGGPAAGVLATGASDRMTDTWVNWTKAECVLPGRKGAAGRANFAGEGEAVKGFADGSLDLAYTAGGYNEEMRLGLDPGQTSLVRRPSVAVPTALNASVLAVAGGDASSGTLVPFRDIKLTIAEVASLISGGGLGFSKPEPPTEKFNNKSYVDLALARNTELKGIFFSNDDAIKFKVAANAEPSAASWYATRMFTALAPLAWRVPEVPVFGPNAGKPRGIDTAMGANPTYAGGLELVSGRPPLVRGLEAAPRSPYGGGTWVLTDLATAKALGLTPVQIENANGDFVAPTPETMAAALPRMVRDRYGVLISDPKATAAGGQVQPYPLTFVEYTLAPAEPLVDEECAARAPAQTLLKGWLEFITGPGQDKLAAGMVPLNVSLRDEAAKAILKVGAAPVSGTCKDTILKKNATSTTARPRATTTTMSKSAPATSAANGPSPGGAAAVAPTDGGFAGSAADGGVPAGASAPAADTAPAAPSGGATATTKPPIPGYAGKAATAYRGTLIGLLGMLAIAGLAAGGPVPIGTAWRRRKAADASARGGRTEPG